MQGIRAIDDPLRKHWGILRWMAAGDGPMIDPVGARPPYAARALPRAIDGVRREVLNAYFVQNNAAGLVGVARTEKNPELKRDIVERLSTMKTTPKMAPDDTPVTRMKYLSANHDA